MTLVRFQSFDPAGRGWGPLTFTRPRAVHAAYALADVPRVLALADAASAAGDWAVVLVSYEAAPAFDPAFRTHDTGGHGFPLAWVARFGPPDCGLAAAVVEGESAFGPWEPLVSPSAYAAALARIRDFIAAGDTYQVNYTFPLRSPFHGDPQAAWHALAATQGAGYSAFLDLGDWQVLSCSPELFLARTGDRLTLRPMKGTMSRGRFAAEDRRQAAALAASPKNRAENLMIVDLLRNDAGRVAATGSVHVPRLFEVERYRTVFQMTSTVEACLRPNLGTAALFAALFPCGSVTGAPKIRTLQIIRELEPLARQLYTGAIGFIRPGGDAVFSVAIRTVLLEARTGEARCGVGGGITWDSSPEDEYDECLLKAQFLTAHPPTFDVLESLLLESGTYFLLERHLRRMRETAEYFSLPWPECACGAELERLRSAHPAGAWKVRLLLGPLGQVRGEAAPLAGSGSALWRVAVAQEPVDSRDPFLFHKTTRRAVYDAALAGHPDADDVILWNERGELTESCRANLVLQIGDEYWTPPVESGLLAGTFRAELVAGGVLRERVLRREELARADAVYLVNSIRRWIQVSGPGLRSRPPPACPP